MLLELAASAKLFHTANSTAFADLTVRHACLGGGGNLATPIISGSCRRGPWGRRVSDEFAVPLCRTPFTAVSTRRRGGHPPTSTRVMFANTGLPRLRAPAGAQPESAAPCARSLIVFLYFVRHFDRRILCRTACTKPKGLARC
jgi:hypothetical protein